jgi:hypothetical protein
LSGFLFIKVALAGTGTANDVNLFIIAIILFLFMVLVLLFLIRGIRYYWQNHMQNLNGENNGLLMNSENPDDFILF